jgi:predicted DNA-binding ribbon-helix-helix protein
MGSSGLLYKDEMEQEDISRSTLVSRNITVRGRRTSVRLEPEMWTALREIAKREQCRIHDICSLIDLRKNPRTSLTAAIRVFLMLYYRAASTDEGHIRARHGNFRNMLERAKLPQGEGTLRGGVHPIIVQVGQ